MNLIILLPNGSATSTNLSAFQSGTDDLQTAIGRDQSVCVEAVALPARVSKQTSEDRSIRSIIARRENSDPAYRERMAAARARVARQAFDDQPESIAAARLRKGLSQMKLAELLGTSQPHVAKIEAGKVRIQFSTAVQLADALGISLDQLRPLVEASISNSPGVLGGSV